MLGLQSYFSELEECYAMLTYNSSPCLYTVSLPALGKISMKNYLSFHQYLPCTGMSHISEDFTMIYLSSSPIPHCNMVFILIFFQGLTGWIVRESCKGSNGDSQGHYVVYQFSRVCILTFQAISVFLGQESSLICTCLTVPSLLWYCQR